MAHNALPGTTVLILALAFIISNLTVVHSVLPWSYQQSLFVPYANKTYGETPPLLVGRGFLTLISGYDPFRPGIFVHTTDDGYISGSKVVWSQQAVLRPTDPLTANDGFGRVMVGYNQTLIVAAPFRINRRGAVYVFNGTERHWSQIQRLTPPETTDEDQYGNSLALHKNRLIIGTKGQSKNSGVAYVYERPSGGLYWSRTARLIPRDQIIDANFGERVALYDNTIAITAKNDNRGDAIATVLTNGGEPQFNTGSAYIFTDAPGAWSQQQKLRAKDFFDFANPASTEPKDPTTGRRFLGPHIGVNKDSIAVGVTNRDTSNSAAQDVVLIYSTTFSSGTYTEVPAQKLVNTNESGTIPFTYSEIHMDARNNLIATLASTEQTNAYVFKSFDSTWSLQQKLQAFEPNAPLNDTSLLLPYTNNATLEEIRSDMNTSFSNAALFGGNLLFRAGDHGGVQIRSQFDDRSCLQLWMSDHFLDGWDTAVLTVRAPDLTNDTFHPHCDQVDPFLVRYCPYQPSDEGTYIVKVFAATAARFFWELSWQVTVEATGETYRGDFATKMEFRYNSTSSMFALVSIQNEVVLETAPCFRCTRIASLSWAQLQIEGNSAFWPLIVTGAPYYISDYEGRNLTSAGSVCDGIITSMCYQTMSDGLYILRLGGGPFGRFTGFPMSNASWTGCGESGGLRDQLIFRIANSKCTPVQKFTYVSRCSLPPSFTATQYT
eukprot:gene15428-17646_t